VVARRRRGRSRYDTSIPVSHETRDELAKLKLLDGEESWDHLIRRAKDALQHAPAQLEADPPEVAR
jgi:hypothetical protein